MTNAEGYIEEIKRKVLFFCEESICENIHRMLEREGNIKNPNIIKAVINAVFNKHKKKVIEYITNDLYKKYYDPNTYREEIKNAILDTILENKKVIQDIIDTSKIQPVPTTATIVSNADANNIPVANAVIYP